MLAKEAGTQAAGGPGFLRFSSCAAEAPPPTRPGERARLQGDPQARVPHRLCCRALGRP